MSIIKIVYEHNIPTWENFKDWGVQLAYPKFDFCMSVYNNDDNVYNVYLIIHGHYYCSGSRNFEITNIERDEDGEIMNINIMIDENELKKSLEDTLCNMWQDKIFLKLLF